jgi:hypothetical protein
MADHACGAQLRQGREVLTERCLCLATEIDEVEVVTTQLAEILFDLAS